MTASKPSGDERRWRLGGYAPGDYLCKCLRCEQTFTGDKRALSCLPCAAQAAASELEALRGERDEAREIVAKCNNSIFGSYGYFTNASGKDLPTAIEDLKADSRKNWRDSCSERDAAVQPVGLIAAWTEFDPRSRPRVTHWEAFRAGYQSAEASLHEVQALNEELVGALTDCRRELYWCAQQLAARGLPGRAGDSVERADKRAEAALLKATPHRGGEGKQGLSPSCVAESGREAAPSSAPGRDGGER